MKSTEQLTQEVMGKIAKKQTARKRLYGCFKCVAAIILIAGVFIPATLQFSFLSNKDNSPMVKPFDQDETAPSSDSSDILETFTGDYDLQNGNLHV